MLDILKTFQHPCHRESHGQRSLEGYSPWGHTESDPTKRLTLSLFFHTDINLCTQRSCCLAWFINIDGVIPNTFGNPPFSPNNILEVLLFFRFLPILHSGMWGLNSLTRGLTSAHCIGRQSLKHWIAKEVQNLFFLIAV